MSGKKFSISFVTSPQNNGWIDVLCTEKNRVAKCLDSWKRINSFLCQNVFVN